MTTEVFGNSPSRQSTHHNYLLGILWPQRLCKATGIYNLNVKREAIFISVSFKIADMRNMYNSCVLTRNTQDYNKKNPAK